MSLQQITFPPQVLARISPEISLERHIELGVRPCLRAFEEFRDVTSNNGSLSRYHSAIESSENDILGSNVLKCGDTIVITSITAGIIEEPATKGCVYPVVDVERGRVGAPTDEEQILSQKLYDLVMQTHVIPAESLRVDVGLRAEDGTVTFGTEVNREWSYVLYANIQVFSRSGPLFDMVWNSLVAALRDTKLPRCFIDERATDLKVPVRTRGRSAAIREHYDIVCSNTEYTELVLSEDIGYSSSFGVVDGKLLADLEGEAEEGIATTMNIVTGKRLKSVSLSGNVTAEQLSRALKLSTARAAQ